MRKKTILILGASSLVGSNLAEFLKKDFRVFGTYFLNPINIPQVTTIKCDVLNKDELQSVFATFRPEYVIYSVGLSSAWDCHDANDYAEALNMLGLFNAADLSQRYKSQIIYISSALVFGGENKSYQERDIPDPNSILGKNKAGAEFFLQKNSLNYLIFRCSQLYGRCLLASRWSFFENIQRKSLQGQQFVMDDHLYQGYLDVMLFAMCIKIAIEKQVSNRLIQVSSQDYMTAYGFSQEYNKVFQQEMPISKSKWSFPYIMMPGSNYDGGNLYYQLNTKNAQGILNIKLPTIFDSLRFTKARLNGKDSNKGKSSNKGELNFI